MCKEYVNLQTGEKLDLGILDELDESSSLKSNFNLWIEWNFENNSLDILEIKKFSNKKVHLICSKCNSEYNIRMCNYHLNKTPCYYCSGKKTNITNCILTTHPNLIAFWDNDKNILTPYEISKGSNKKVWWKCDICKLSYEMAVSNKVKGNNCGYCYGSKTNYLNSLITIYPDIAEYWHPTKNKLLPSEVRAKSEKKVWWIGDCKHEWEARICDRVKSRGCPYCTNSNSKVLIGFNDMWTTVPEFAKLLLDTNDGYLYSRNSTKKVDWKCGNCESIIKNKPIYEITNNRLSCHNCRDNMSFGEKFVYQLLKLNNIEFNYDCTTEFSGKYRYDFIIDNYILEVHGEQHYRDTGFSKISNTSHLKQVETDNIKKELALSNGYNYYVMNASNTSITNLISEFKNTKLYEILNIEESTLKDIDLSNSIIAEAWQMYFEEGISIREISDKLKVSTNAISRYIKMKN